MNRRTGLWIIVILLVDSSCIFNFAIKANYDSSLATNWIA
jgi:hypothetical protein